MSTAAWITLIFFALSYVGLGLGKIPGLPFGRASIAAVGGLAMLVFRLVSPGEAFHSIDWDTLLLLLGMMVVVGSLESSGFFRKLAYWSRLRIHGPYVLLAWTIAASGFFSAWFVNDIVCLALTPLIFHLARRLDLDPLPHMLAVATASNLGSVATIVGNPQNMIIGQLSMIPYARFALHLAPLAVAGLVIDFLLIAWIYRGRLRKGRAEEAEKAPLTVPDESPALMKKSLVVAGLTLALFFTGLRISWVALGAALLLLVGRTRPRRVYERVDWALLVMFAGLFVIVRAVEIHLITLADLEHWGTLAHPSILNLSGMSAVFSNLVSNVPAVLLLKPMVTVFPAPAREGAWLALAMSSTLAGNLTILGSVANLIVVESLRRERFVVTFWDYLKIGLPLTLVTLGLGVVWLSWSFSRIESPVSVRQGSD